MNLDELLELCLSQIEQGASVAECLARYSAHATELEPLLRLATTLSEAAPRQLPDEAFLAARRSLSEVARHAAVGHRAPTVRARTNPLLQQNVASDSFQASN